MRYDTSVPPFQMIYPKSIYCDFVLHSDFRIEWLISEHLNTFHSTDKKYQEGRENNGRDGMSMWSRKGLTAYITK
jgi:hypothetical protein